MKIYLKKGIIILLLFTISLLSTLLVVFRMKSIELDYQISEVGQKILKMQLEQKELRALLARDLSTEKLARLAKEFKLSKAKEEQIIIIE